MTEQPPVSVIIPCKNTEKFIGRAIESILKQTCQNFEIIVINDGSTDNTGDVINEFAEEDGRVRYIVFEQSVGLCEALNAGICSSHYDWIARMDGDDISLPNRLERQLEYIRRYPAVKVVGCLPYYIDSKDRVIGKMNLDTFTPEEFQKKMMEGKLIFIPGGASLIHKPTIQELGGFSREFEFIEDLEINMRFALNGYLILNVPEYLYMYRKREFTNTSDAFEINRRMRWIKKRVQSSRIGTYVPNYEEYCKTEKSKPFLQRLRIFKEDWGTFFFKKFGLHLAKREPVRAFAFLLCTLLTKPSYALHKLRPRTTDTFQKITSCNY